MNSSTPDAGRPHWHDLSENFEDLFETAPYGLLALKPSGYIYRANSQFGRWIGRNPAELIGTRFSDFLTISGKVYFETHLRPLLRLQGFFDQIAFELPSADGEKLPVFVNGVERRDEAGNSLFVRVAVFSATDRRRYESELLASRSAAVTGLSDERRVSGLREQFIAVLGHDLRNPLAALDAGVRMIARTPLDGKALQIVPMMRQSVTRMAGLIDNVMDFARGRLGGGLTLDRKSVDLDPHILQVVEELRAGWPGRTIEMDLASPLVVNCDPARLSQLLSNLVANALTHGAEDGPVTVHAAIEDGELLIHVVNSGDPISPSARERLFEPFTREGTTPSKQGLGLGLYIASEIARAHGGKVSVDSSEEETRFTLRIPHA
jgi:phosphoserine phosphatase RsbU/P